MWRATVLLAAMLLALAGTLPALAAPFAAVVMDARDGRILYSENGDARLHPASLTKMMTLYVAFDAIRRGEIGMDTMVTVSAKAAAEPPSRLGLRAGQRISMRNLIRAAAIKSANDAATAIGEAISGSEAAFARRMTAAARALGMHNSTFRNAHGLTAPGHLSTARDMTVLGRRLFYDFPEHYGLFSRLSVDAGVARVANTNRRFLESYRGADGIKTGYTRAAGFNLTASAERGGKRLIATVFGGTSTVQRNAKIAELLDMGFAAAPARVAANRPAAVDLPTSGGAAAANTDAAPRATAKTIRLVTAPSRSPRPLQRPVAPAEAAPAEAAPAEALVSEAAPAAVVPDAAVADAVQDAIDAGLRDAFAGRVVPQPRARPATLAAAFAAAEPPPAPPPAAPSVTPADGAAEIVAAVAAALAEDTSATIAGAAASVSPMRPAPRKLAADLVAADPAPAGPGAADLAAPDLAAADLAAADLAAADPAAAEPLPSVAVGAADADAIALAASGPGGAPAGIEDLPLLGEDAADVPPAVAAVMPIARPDPAADAGAIILTAGTDPAAASALAGQGQAGDAAAEVAVRLSTSGGRYWGITLGRFPSRGTAERALLQTGLSEAETLGTALRKVVPRGAGYEATFHGLSREEADLACRRLAARGTACFAVGP